MKLSSDKKNTIDSYKKHISSGKVKFFQKYEMDFVTGKRAGSILHDIDGKKELINLHCNGGVFNLGHRNSDIIQVVKEALDETDIGNHHLMSKERAKLGAMLSDLLPGDLNYTIFGVSGGEAIDLALKVARGYTERTEIISAVGGYHGHTGLALAAGDAKYRDPFKSSLPDFIQVPFNDLKMLQKTTSNKTAAIILETVPATLGMAIPHKEYIQGVRKICDDNKIIFIVDEIQSGLSRTGKLWAFEHFDIIPDIVVLGKGLSGGIYPVSATIIREPLETVFHADPFIHISTFGGSEIGCRAAIKVLEISSSPEFLDQVQSIAEQFKVGFDKLIDKHKGFLIGLRQLGLMMGIELKDDICGPILTKTAYDHGLLLVYANNDTSICQLLPPLTIRPKEVEMVLDKLDKSIKSAQKLRMVYSAKQKFDKYKNILTGKKRSLMRFSDTELIAFESGLDPLYLNQSKIPAKVIGYGEISTVFEIDGDEKNAYKRLALFENRESAEDYTNIYNAYCNYLRKSGLNLPDDETVIIDNDNRATVLYIVQSKLDPKNFAHKLILNYTEQQASELLTKICDEIEKVWKFNSQNNPDLEFALDGQLSNWVIENDYKIFYVDTSTPLFKIKDVEQLNPDLILKTAPSFLRWILRLFFLKDVMNRYYEPRSVYMDLIANLHKEQRPDLVPIAIDIVNKYIKEPERKFDIGEINKYYKEDKLIWTLFLAFRKFDRFLKSKIFHQRYEYILPGKIKR